MILSRVFLLAKVSIPMVGKDRDNALTLAQPFGDFNRVVNVSAGGDAAEEALLPNEAVRDINRVLVGDLDDLVYKATLHHLLDYAPSNLFAHTRRGGDAVANCILGRGWFQADHLTLGEFSLQCPSNAI